MRRACPAHARIDCPTCAARPKRNGSTRAWRDLRQVVLDRDGYSCQLRLDGCGLLATHVDHIVPVSAGGTDTLANLRASCANCNLAKGAQTHA